MVFAVWLMAAVWIVGYGLNNARQLRDMEPEPADGDQRNLSRFRLHPQQNTPWLHGRLESVGLPPTSLKRDRTRGVSSGFQVLGLAHVIPGGIYSSLTSTPELQWLHKLFRLPLDAYIVNVVSARFLREDDIFDLELYFTSRGKTKQLRQTFSLCTAVLNNHVLCGRPLYRDNQVPATFAQLLAEWGVPADEPALCCLYPRPIADLIVHGRWQSMMWLGRWHVPWCGWRDLFGNWPPGDWVSATKNCHTSDRQADLTPDALRSLANSWREWAPALLGTCTSHASRQAVEQRLREHLNLLDLWSNAMGLEGPQSKTNKRLMHSSAKVLSTLQVVFASKHGASGYIRTIMLALQAIFTPATAKALVEQIHAGHYLPHRNSVVSYRLALDIAHILLSQRELAKEASCLRFMWLDSSPQFGRNWLWIRQMSIPGDLVVHTFDSVLELGGRLQAIPRHDRRDTGVAL